MNYIVKFRRKKLEDLKSEFQLYGMKPRYFFVFCLMILLAAYLGFLPEGMIGCIVFMVALGTVMHEIGERLPIVNKYLGGGATFTLFGAAVLNYFNLLPALIPGPDGSKIMNMALLQKEDLVGNIQKFFKPNGAFLDFYVAALLTGSILGMNRSLLKKAAVRYFPAIFGALIVSFSLCSLAGTLMHFGFIKSLLLIALPIMGGGMGAGATPLSKIFESSGTMTASEAISIMTPAVAIGNALSIILAGIIANSIKNAKLNGNGSLMKAQGGAGIIEDESPELIQKKNTVTVATLGIGLFAAGAFFAWGYILQGLWKIICPKVVIHAYAWMILSVGVCKLFNLLPEKIELACYHWYLFIQKTMTPMLLFGIGLCYLDINVVLKSMNWVYFILCFLTSFGAFLGAAIVGNFVGFYPVESGITAGLCMSNMGGTGDVAVLSAGHRMDLMAFAQISSRLGGAIILVIGSFMLSFLGGLL